jgi:HAD superfamily hydrolase (TIGR01450 family)
MKLADFEAVLFDMDGTLYHVDAPLPAAAEAVEAARRVGVAYACMTNNSARTASELSDRLAAMGITVPADAIFTSSQAMAAVIRQHWPRPTVLNLAGDALPIDLGPGVDYVDGEQDDCDVVAVGVHGPLDETRALVALHHLRRDAHLVAGSNDRIYPVGNDRVAFGSGAWAAMLAFAADLPDHRHHNAGKPDAAFYITLCEKLAVSPSRCLLVGDNLESDVAGGQHVGMATALLLTGVADRGDIDRLGIHPDRVFEHLPALLDELG